MLIIRGIEVTQGIQYYRADQHLTDPADRGPDNSLALVANKVAWVRVYVETDAAGTVANVAGTLEVEYGVSNINFGQSALTLNPQPPGQVTALYHPDYATTRGSVAATLNFIIPAARMSGALVLTAKVSSGTLAASQVAFVSASMLQTMKVRGIMIGYNGPNPANTASTLNIPAPGLGELQSTAALAMRMMPVQANAVFQVASTITRTAPLTGTATNGGCTSDWLNLNAAVAVAKSADGNLPSFLYYGLIAATFPNLSNNGGCESSGVSTGFSGSQLAMVHELGHACGRSHAPCGSVGTSADPNYPAYEPYDTPAARVASIGEFGLDITNGAVPTPNTAHDYMSYCGPAWISIYGHQALINNGALNPEPVPGRYNWWDHYVTYDPWWWLHYIPDPPPNWIDPAEIATLPMRTEQIISVIGILHADDRVEVLSVTRTAVRSTNIAGTATDLRAILHGAKNAELASTSIFTLPSRGSCGCHGKTDQGTGSWLFQAYVPDVALGTALSIERGDQVLWKRKAPKSHITVSAARVKRTPEDQVDVRWTVREGYVEDTWVRVSADEGKTWRSVATGVTGRKVEVDPSQLPTGKLMLQVVVHDGFSSVSSKPVAFENALMPPVPAIIHPHSGRRLVAGQALYLWGSVAEQEGADRGAFRYTWLIDGKHAGDDLQVIISTPAAGPHKCELQVRDAKGKVLRSTGVDFLSVAS